ncbi:MAG: hypothetical protein LBE13_04275 [Bacteroidales bacterium]|nr:hypothetical protein [Bacteroidales bacterium]
MINPITITIIFSLGLELFRVIIGPIVLIQNGLFNRYYQYALWITNLDLFIGFVITVLLIKFFSRNFFTNRIAERIHCNKKIKRQHIVFLGIFFFIAALFFFYKLANTSFSIMQWIKEPRIGYQYHRTGAGHFYALFLLSLSTSFTLVLLYTKKTINTILLFVFYLFVIRLFGSKGEYLRFFLAFLAILWFRQYKNLNSIIFMTSPFIILLMIFMLNPSEIIDILKYFDYYSNSAMYFEAYSKNQIDLFYGEIFLTGFWGLLPRVYFPDKPYVYGFLLVNEFFFPGAAKGTHTPAFGGPMAAFADFGILGVILYAMFNMNTLLTTFCYYLLFARYNIAQVKCNVFLLVLFLSTIAPSFLSYFSFPVTAILVIFFFFMIDFFSRLNCNVLLKPSS